MESDWLFKLILTSILTQGKKFVCYNSIHIRIIELSSGYSPVQSDFRSAIVLRYNPSNQNVQLEFVKVTIRDMQDIFSTKNEEIWNRGH